MVCHIKTTIFLDGTNMQLLTNNSFLPFLLVLKESTFVFFCKIKLLLCITTYYARKELMLTSNT